MEAETHSLIRNGRRALIMTVSCCNRSLHPSKKPSAARGSNMAVGSFRIRIGGSVNRILARESR